MKVINLLKNIKSLSGRCGWGVPEDLCTADELGLRRQYVILSTQYYILLGIIPGQINSTLN